MTVMLSAAVGAQTFPLGEIDSTWFVGKNSGEATFHAYLVDHLEARSGVKAIIRTPADYDRHENPCHYGQAFAGGVYIDVQTGKCSDEDPNEVNLYIPGTSDINEFKTWVEQWHKATAEMKGLDRDEYGWANDEYRPVDELSAGCFYAIMKDDFGRLQLSVYCGC